MYTLFSKKRKKNRMIEVMKNSNFKAIETAEAYEDIINKMRKKDKDSYDIAHTFIKQIKDDITNINSNIKITKRILLQEDKANKDNNKEGVLKYVLERISDGDTFLPKIIENISDKQNISPNDKKIANLIAEHIYLINTFESYMKKLKKETEAQIQPNIEENKAQIEQISKIFTENPTYFSTDEEVAKGIENYCNNNNFSEVEKVIEEYNLALKKNITNTICNIHFSLSTHNEKPGDYEIYRAILKGYDGITNICEQEKATHGFKHKINTVVVKVDEKINEIEKKYTKSINIWNGVKSFYNKRIKPFILGVKKKFKKSSPN